MSWAFCLSGAAVAKAGFGANTDITMSGAILDAWSDQVEASINTQTRKDWVADIADVTANFVNMLGEIESDMVAMKIINYDMAGYTSRLEATTMIDVLNDNKNKNINFLKEKENQNPML